MKSSSVIKSLLGFSLPSWVNAIVGFLVVPIYTRVFSTEELGKYGLFLTYGSILMNVALCGINQGYIRFYNEKPGKCSPNSMFRLCLVLLVFPTLIVDIIILGGYGFFSQRIIGTESLLFASALALSTTATVFSSLIQARYRMSNRVGVFAVFSILLNIANKCVYLVASAIDGKATTASYLYCAANVLLTIVFMFTSLHATGGGKISMNKQSVTPILKFSIPLVPVALVATVNTGLPKLMMERFLSYSDIGIYTSANSVVSIISVLQAGLNLYWVPFVYKNYKDKKELLQKMHYVITFLMVAFGLVIILFQDIIFLLIGEKYKASQAFFALLLFSPICYTIAETTGLGINISKKSYLNIITHVFGIIVNFVISLWLLPVQGLLGAGIAVAVSAFAMFICRTIIGERYYKVVTNYKKTLFAPILFLIVALMTSFFFSLTALRYLASIVAIILLCIVYRREIVYLFNLAKPIIDKLFRRSNTANT